MRFWIQLGALLLAMGGCKPAPPHRPHVETLRTGDLLFLDLDCPECDAIAEVTREQFSVSGPALSHVGIVAVGADGETHVIEAWPGAGVTRTPLRRFLSRIKGGRNAIRGYRHLRPPAIMRRLADDATTRATKLLGLPYDDTFVAGDRRYYCSELIAELFRLANGGKAVFRLQPMFFGGTKAPVRRVWSTYFAKHKVPIPDGQPGISPLGVYLQALTMKWGQP